MAIEILDSAHKHGFSDEQILWAIMNPVLMDEAFEEPESPDDLLGIAWLGPAGRGGVLVEVFAAAIPPRTLQVFHCMEFRSTTVQRMEGHDE